MTHRFEDLRDSYEALWDAVEPLDGRLKAIDHIIDTIATGRPRYEFVQHLTGVPWTLIACLHNMECSLSFKHHLHNGDPMQHEGQYRRTVNVPAGRPLTIPPWTWEESAEDALTGMRNWKDWGVAGCLYQAEAFNGWGYRGKGIHSPYLWGGSNEQERGKYISDHVWSATAMTDQIGVATILARMEDRNVYTFPEDRDNAP